DFLPVYRSLGFKKLKIGDAAIVDLTSFTLEGRARRRLRARIRQLARAAGAGARRASGCGRCTPFSQNGRGLTSRPIPCPPPPSATLVRPGRGLARRDVPRLSKRAAPFRFKRALFAATAAPPRPPAGSGVRR